jgi:hypothetical protein
MKSALCLLIVHHAIFLCEMSTTQVQTLANELAALSKSYSANDDDNTTGYSIVAKAKELISNVQKPMDHAQSELFGMVEPAVIRTLMLFGVFKAIPSQPGSITLNDLEKVTGAQASLLARLLRVVAGTGLIIHQQSQDGNSSYEHTQTSQAYGQGFIGSIFPAIYDELVLTVSLPEYYRSHRHSEPDGDASMTCNPQTWRSGCEGQMTAFEALEKDPERLRNFHVLSGMAERFRPWTGFYDFGKLAQDSEGDRPVFVDIGGGNGTMIEKLLLAHPNIKPEQCILQDRESVISLAKERQGDGSLPAGVQCAVHDFFTPQPVKGAKAYHFRAITHDWSDSIVVKILSNVVPAMVADSKILIGDNVIPEQGAEGLAGLMDVMMLGIGKSSLIRTLSLAPLRGLANATSETMRRNILAFETSHPLTLSPFCL